jgi:hypothetical protein
LRLLNGRGIESEMAGKTALAFWESSRSGFLHVMSGSPIIGVLEMMDWTD